MEGTALQDSGRLTPARLALLVRDWAAGTEDDGPLGGDLSIRFVRLTSCRLCSKRAWGAGRLRFDPGLRRLAGRGATVKQMRECFRDECRITVPPVSPHALHLEVHAKQRLT